MDTLDGMGAPVTHLALYDCILVSDSCSAMYFSVEPRLQAAAGNLGTCYRHRLHCSVPQRELRLFNPT